MKPILLALAVLGLFAAGFTAGWVARDYQTPVGGIPTAAAAMQMAAPLSENEAGQTATPPATDPATSTAAPTVAQPTSAPTATATPTKEEWEIECPSTGGTIKCHDVIVSEDGETARLYWVGPCLDPYSLRLAKKAHGQVFPELLSGEWAFKFIPNKCDRPSDRASRNYLLIRTFAGPGEYAMTFEPVGSNSVYIEFFEWSNAPAATAPTPSATTTTEPTVMPTPAGAMAETATPAPVEWVSPFDYGGICIYDVRLDGNYYWVSQNSDWSLWNTAPYGDGGYFVLGFDEVSGQIRWLIGDGTDPCIEGGQLAGVVGLQSYLRGIGREDLFIPPPPAGLDDLD